MASKSTLFALHRIGHQLRRGSLGAQNLVYWEFVSLLLLAFSLHGTNGLVFVEIFLFLSFSILLPLFFNYLPYPFPFYIFLLSLNFFFFALLPHSLANLK